MCKPGETRGQREFEPRLAPNLLVLMITYPGSALIWASSICKCFLSGLTHLKDDFRSDCRNVRSPTTTVRLRTPLTRIDHLDQLRFDYFN